MNYPAVIKSFTTGSYQVTRRLKGEYIKGILVSSAPTTFLIEASAQPSSAKILSTLPEGLRSEKAYTIYTTVELFSRERLQAVDTIEIRGEVFDIVQSTRFDSLDNPAFYYRSIAVRVISD